MGAGSTVGASSAKLCAGHAQAAEAIAEGSVDEDFELYVRAGFPDTPDFLDGQLPAEHHLLEAETLHFPHSFDRVDGELGGGVQLEVGEVPSAETCKSEILDDDAVAADERSLLEQVVGVLDIIILQQGVQGDDDLLPVLASVGGDPSEFIEGEVLRFLAGGETGESEINGVCAAFERGKAGLHAAGGK